MKTAPLLPHSRAQRDSGTAAVLRQPVKGYTHNSPHLSPEASPDASGRLGEGMA